MRTPQKICVFRKYGKQTAGAVGVLLLFAAAAGAFQSPAKGLSFGVVPQFEPRRIRQIWQPILKRVSAKSGVSFTLTGSPSIPDFETAFTRGEFDFAYMNPYHLLVANRAQGYIPLLRDVGRDLFGIIVVRKDSPVSSIRELDGKTLAFPAPNALGATLLPRAEFYTRFQIQVIPRYVRSHTSVYLNVILRQTEAGGGVQKTLTAQKPEIRRALRILYETVRVPSHPVAVHPRVVAAVRRRVRTAFFDMEKTDTGCGLLSKIPMKTVGSAEMEDYAPLKELGLEAFYVDSPH